MKRSAPSGRRHGRSVGRIIARRLTTALPILLVVTAGIFGLATVSPLDPLDGYLSGQSASLTPELRDQLRHDLGLDRPWWQAWAVWLSNALHGELGQSLVYHQSVAEVIGERIGWTVLLGAVGLAGAVSFAVALAIPAAVRPGSVLGRAAASACALIQAVPPFLLGIGIIGVFAVGARLLPSGGLTDPGEDVTVASLLRHLVLPGFVFALSQLPWLVLGLRQTLVETLRSEPVLFARLRGIPRRTIIRRHVVPVAAPPFVALLASRLPELVAGSAIVEAVFAWPGLGSAIVVAAQRLDFALLCALSVATTALVLASALLADVLYVLMDPRVSDDV